MLHNGFITPFLSLWKVGVDSWFKVLKRTDSSPQGPIFAIDNLLPNRVGDILYGTASVYRAFDKLGG